MRSLMAGTGMKCRPQSSSMPRQPKRGSSWMMPPWQDRSSCGLPVDASWIRVVIPWWKPAGPAATSSMPALDRSPARSASGPRSGRGYQMTRDPVGEITGSGNLNRQAAVQGRSPDGRPHSAQRVQQILSGRPARRSAEDRPGENTPPAGCHEAGAGITAERAVRGISWRVIPFLYQGHEQTQPESGRRRNQDAGSLCRVFHG